MGRGRRRLQSTVPVLAAVCLLQLLDSTHCQGNSSLVLDSAVPTLPVLVAPSGWTGPLKTNGSYSLYPAGISSLEASRSRNFTIAPNTTLILKSFRRVTCTSLSLTGSAQVYAFFTRAGITADYSGKSKGGYLLRRDPRSYIGAEVYPSAAITSNATIARLLAAGPLANSTSGVVTATTNLTEFISVVLVNPGNSTETVGLDMAFSSLGPCQACMKQRDQNGLLGACGSASSANATNATVLVDGQRLNASDYDFLLLPGQADVRDLDQGTSAVFSVFTNASCMLYTIKSYTGTADFNLNKALVTAWVSSSGQQQQIVQSGTVTDQQQESMACAYPAYQELNRPCYVYNDQLDPKETYYVWAKNKNGGTAASGGNVSVTYELMVMTDPADCSRDRFFNLSGSSLYLSTPSAALAYTQVTNTSERSPYDPGVTPFAFLAGQGNSYFNYPITQVFPDGSLSQVGSWNITFDGDDPTKLRTAITDSDLITYPMGLGQTRVLYPGAGTFTNAACFSEYLNATNPVTSFLLPRSTYRANYNYSTALPLLTGLTTGAYDNSVVASRQFRVQSVDISVPGLLPNETYSFAVGGAIRNGTYITTRTAMYPPGAAGCNHTAVLAGGAPAPAPAAYGQLQPSGAVRGVFDYPITQYGDGGADVVGTVFGASCIAFALAARGTVVNDTAPPLSSQYYNISWPSNVTEPKLSASALLLEGFALNNQFVQLGFPNSTDSTAPLPIVTGCVINATNPGPCFAYADNLNPEQVYYLWAVIGAKTPTSWVLASYEALPSGSCKGLFPGVQATLAANSTVTSAAAKPSSSSVSVGVIVGPIVAGVAAIAAVILTLVIMRRRRRPKGPKGALMEDAFSATNAFPWEETEANYAFFKDVIGPGGESVTVESIMPSAFHDKQSTVDFKSGSKSTAETTTESGIVPDSRTITSHTAISATATHQHEQSASVQSATGTASSETAALASAGAPQSQSSGAVVADFHDEWEIKLSELKLKVVDGKAMKLGEGGFGSVFLGFLGVREVAVKIATGNSAVQKEKFLHEILILKGCRDPNIVQFLGASVSDQQIVCVMEFMPGGDLYKAIGQDTAGQFLWWKNGSKLALDVVKGLYHLHSKNIVHMDLKTPNILLNASRDQGKISDVGLAKFTSEAGTIATGGASFMWASPEQLLSGKCTAASDMFSFGVVLWEICTGEPPARTRQYRPLTVPDECPQAVADLVVQCLDPEAANRPTAQEAHHILQKCARKRPPPRQHSADHALPT